MSAHMNFSFLVDRTLLKISLSVVRSTVVVVTSPGELIIFFTTVSQVKFVSAFSVELWPQFSQRWLS